MKSNLNASRIVCRSMDGRIVHQLTGPNLETEVELILPVSAGMYLVELTAGDRRLVQRVAIDR